MIAGGFLINAKVWDDVLFVWVKRILIVSHGWSAWREE